jgi:hypothetical protein
MTHIVQIIASAKDTIPFNQNNSQAFLDNYDTSDQCALISALYIGRDHIHYAKLDSEYFVVSEAESRFYHTGRSPKWAIDPSDFAHILYEKSDSLAVYFDAFIRCANGSNFDLARF